MKLRILVGNIIAFAIIIVALSLAIPVPAQNTWLIFHSYLGLAILVTSLDIGASIVFIRGLDTFTPQLKRSYQILCVGLSLLGIALLQVPFLIAIGQLNGLWKNTGLIALPFLVALICVFMGIRSLAKLFDIESILTKLWFALLITIICAVLFGLVPHPPIPTSELEYDGSNGFTVFNIVVLIFSVLNILRIKRIASIVYTEALAWLSLGFGTMAIAGLSYLVAISFTGTDGSNIIAASTLIPHALAGILLLRSAHAFNLIANENDTLDPSIERNFFGKPRINKKSKRVSSIDVVTFTANLVSNPREIDSILDRMRIVTARMKPGQAPSPEDDHILMEIYLEIERYLLGQEPIRKFTQETLRQDIVKRLGPTSVHRHTFWKQLP